MPFHSLFVYLASLRKEMAKWQSVHGLVFGFPRHRRQQSFYEIWAGIFRRESELEREMSMKASSSNLRPMSRGGRAETGRQRRFPDRGEILNNVALSCLPRDNKSAPEMRFFGPGYYGMKWIRIGKGCQHGGDEKRSMFAFSSFTHEMKMEMRREL